MLYRAPGSTSAGRGTSRPKKVISAPTDSLARATPERKSSGSPPRPRVKPRQKGLPAQADLLAGHCEAAARLPAGAGKPSVPGSPPTLPPVFITEATFARGGEPPPRHATPPRNGHRRGPAVANPPAGRGRPSTRRPEAEEETAAPFYLRFWRGERPRPHPRSPVSLPTPPAAGKGGTAAAALEPGSGAAPPPPPTPALRAPAAPYLCRRPRCLRAVRRPSRRQSCEAGARRPPSPSSAAPACQRGRSGRGEAASRGAGAWGRPAGEGRRGARRGRGGGGGHRHTGDFCRAVLVGGGGTWQNTVACDSTWR